jgi:hypothetical protein
MPGAPKKTPWVTGYKASAVLEGEASNFLPASASTISILQSGHYPAVATELPFRKAETWLMG